MKPYSATPIAAITASPEAIEAFLFNTSRALKDGRPKTSTAVAEALGAPEHLVWAALYALSRDGHVHRRAAGGESLWWRP